MDDLIDFLRAQLDDDEQALEDCTGSGWHWVGGELRSSLDQVVMPQNGDGYWPRPGDAEHIARHDPARVLADVAAKRRIIDMHRYGGVPPLSASEECRLCISDWPCSTLRLLALPFADRDGYRDEWRPND